MIPSPALWGGREFLRRPMNDLQLEAFVRSMLRDSTNTMSTEMMLLYLRVDHKANLTFQRVRDVRIRILVEKADEELLARRP